MPGSGTRTFRDPDRYEASLRRAQIEAVITPVGEFRARVTWVELHHLKLLRCEEEVARIGYFGLPPNLVFVTFPHSGAVPVWCGARVQLGCVMLHSCGERFHQATATPAGWSVIAMDSERLASYFRALTGRPLLALARGRLLGSTGGIAVTQLRRLHTQACRLAVTKPHILTHHEVARAVEQNLIQVLVAYLANAELTENGTAAARHLAVMEKFEGVLIEHGDRRPPIPEVCRLIGVSNVTLRACCAEMLGVSPRRYMMLRRLKHVRIALRDADPSAAKVAELAGRYGFTELGRFAGLYRSTFGETPSATLRRTRETLFSDP